MFQDSQLLDPGTGAENDVIWPTDKILIWYSPFSIWGKAIFFLIFKTFKALRWKMLSPACYRHYQSQLFTAGLILSFIFHLPAPCLYMKLWFLYYSYQLPGLQFFKPIHTHIHTYIHLHAHTYKRFRKIGWWKFCMIWPCNMLF